MDQDKTVELVTNLDRAAVEDKLRQIVAEAKARGLDHVVTQLDNFAGAGKDDLQKRTEGYGKITQGSLEQANVDVVSEMSDLIAAQRAYEMNAKVISAADQMMQSTTALFR